jgi:hypothetical protein
MFEGQGLGQKLNVDGAAGTAFEILGTFGTLFQALAHGADSRKLLQNICAFPGAGVNDRANLLP